MIRKPVLLITGAGGEIGHGLIERLAKEGNYGVVALDVRPLDPPLASLCSEAIVGSILDTNLLERISSQYEIEGIFQRKPRATNQNVERTGTGGFGLGLPIVVELLAQIGGRIEVMSRVGQGTTFWLFLPVKPLDNVVPIRNEERESGKMLREVVRIRKPGG